MIDFIKEWIVSIAIICTASGMYMMLCPKGNAQRGVKLCISLITMIAIITPFFYSLDIEALEDILPDKENQQQSAIDVSAKEVTLALENEIRSYFTNEGLIYSYVKASLSAENDTYSIIDITLYSKKEEVSKAKKILTDTLKIKEMLINVKELE